MPSSRCESIGPTQSRVKAQNLTDAERQAMIQHAASEQQWRQAKVWIHQRRGRPIQLPSHNGVRGLELVESSMRRGRLQDNRVISNIPHERELWSENEVEERMKFALSFVKKNHVFDDMHDVVHVDEKWFFLTKNKGKFYVYDDETLPHRQSKSKRFITNNVPLCCCAAPCTKTCCSPE
ncbi:hypothetical protein DYB31_014448 [Aphanomyces astaci]|uniref:Uncharacterized protein n=1 Tax=Aphanomyces astaci TaxID=112090 RepID=A0A397FD95_APHAT|nr:hypothetical protein DYB31_014448 [Aphanomyces astaci]